MHSGFSPLENTSRLVAATGVSIRTRGLGLMPRGSSLTGFTLIELLLVLAIFLVVGVAVTPLYSNFSVTMQLNEEVSQLVQNIRVARIQSLTGLNNTNHGICFNPDLIAPALYIIYSGTTCATRNQTLDRIVSLTPALEITTTFPANDLNFDRAGIPLTAGTITLTHTTSAARQITVNTLGLVEEN